ncbi:MAG: hypothetical protein B9S32_09485 [Verrucomicrobia bacterium Tous-C9LFEB]|nr:MAG: hypothetical protein B9S32_09485 [Verrucomicrobia bacterium Tous-C9LFEB]
MKILLVSSSSGSRGGGEKFLISLAKSLTGIGHEVLLWTSEHSRMDELCAEFSPYGKVLRSAYHNTYDYLTRPLATLWNGSDVRRFASEWDALDVDVVHVNKQNLEDGLDLLRATRLCRAPSVCTIHLTQGEVIFGAKFGWFRDWISARELKRYAGLYVTVLESRSEELRRVVAKPNRVITIDNGVAPFDFSRKASYRADVRKRFQWGEDHFVICCVARMVEQKRPQLFLDLALRYHQHNRQARFLWVGDGTHTEEWDERVQEAGAGEWIRRLSWQQEVAPYLAAADLYLHTAAYEGCPFSLLEAMAAGLPCIVARDLLETMPSFTEGELTAVDSAQGLEVLDLSTDSLRQMAGRGQEIVAERFSLQAMARRYEAVYRQLALAPRL